MDHTYGAFISYSHDDAEFAGWLHSRLETYRFPKSLVGRTTVDGTIPDRLPPIFRDREELPAATSLTEKVQAALRASHALVVVCTPSSAKSRWVNREIELFREINPGKPILLALARGEPSEAFPPAILEEEPLAADFREVGDGRKLGLLKLLAGLSGAPLGDLVQRNAQRTMRRVMAITGLSVVLMAIMAAMTVVAIQAREEAELQRSEAEGLVRFMQTDLRKRLDDVGRLDLLTAANERALAYYSAQDAADLEPESLALRAQILHAMGQDLELGGNLQGALAAFQEASETTGALLASDPDNPELIFSHAQSEFWVGFAALREMRYAETQRAFESYKELADQLLAIDPDNPDWQMEVAYAASNLGTMAANKVDHEEVAIAHFLEGIEFFQKVRAARPDDLDLLMEIADSYGWLGTLYSIAGNYEKARRANDEERRRLNVLIELDPQNAKYQRDLMGNNLGSAMIERKGGNRQRAVEIMRANYRFASQLVRADPANQEVKIQQVMTLLRLFETDRAAALELSPQGVCTAENQALDPEIGILCGIIGEDIIRTEELEQFLCRIRDGELTLRFSLNPREDLPQFEDICGER